MIHRLVGTALVAGAVAVFTTGCSGIAAIGAAAADSQQTEKVQRYASNQPSTKVFTAASKAMASWGKAGASDRESGTLQGQRGNWLLSVSITGKSGMTGSPSVISLATRYVPSKQMDFNSGEGLKKEYIAKLQQELGEQLIAVTE